MKRLILFLIRRMIDVKCLQMHKEGWEDDE